VLWAQWQQQLEPSPPSLPWKQGSLTLLCLLSIIQVMVIPDMEAEATAAPKLSAGPWMCFDRDVTTKMADDGVCDIRDFRWESQLRYYWEHNLAPPSGVPPCVSLCAASLGVLSWFDGSLRAPSRACCCWHSADLLDALLGCTQPAMQLLT
jgi:hypothetical protein